jgi:hypothetical protein
MYLNEFINFSFKSFCTSQARDDIRGENIVVRLSGKSTDD